MKQSVLTDAHTCAYGKTVSLTVTSLKTLLVEINPENWGNLICGPGIALPAAIKYRCPSWTGHRSGTDEVATSNVVQLLETTVYSAFK